MPKRVSVPGVSIWPQPKKNPRQRYRMTYTRNGERRTIYASTDLQTTVEMAIEISKDIERERVGLAKSDDFRHAEQDRIPTDKHLEQWHQFMLDDGCTPRHAKQFLDYARAVL